MLLYDTEVGGMSYNKSERRATVARCDCRAIISKRSLKQLGVMIDDKLNFGSHVGNVAWSSALAVNQDVE